LRQLDLEGDESSAHKTPFILFETFYVEVYGCKSKLIDFLDALSGL
jgi:hypothetical protein